MAVAAMGRRNPVAIGEMQHYASRAAFFAGIEMNEARNITLGEFDVQPLLEFPDSAHDTVGLQQIGLRHQEWILGHPGLLLKRHLVASARWDCSLRSSP